MPEIANRLSIYDACFHTHAQELIALSRDALTFISNDQKIIWMNQQAEAMYGCSSGDSVNKTVSELLATIATDLPPLSESIAALIVNVRHHFDVALHLNNQAPQWIRFSLQQLQQEPMGLHYFCLCGTDVTAEKQASAAADHLSNEYQDLLNTISDIVFRLDINGCFTFLNQAWERIAGIPVHSSLGTNITFYIEPEQEQQALDAWLFHSEVGEVEYQSDMRLFFNETIILWVQVCCTKVMDEQGCLVGFKGTCKDITSKKENGHYYELLSQHVDDLITLHEDDGRYVLLSPSIKTIAGYEPAELVGKSAYAYFHKEDVIRIAENHESYLITGDYRYEQITYRYKRKDGTYIWLCSKVKRFYDGFAGRDRLVVISKVAQEKMKEESKALVELQETNQLNERKSGFIDFISHEFAAPLQNIRSISELIHLKLKSANTANMATTVLTSIRQVDNEVARLTVLIADVILLEKLSNNQIQLQPSPLDVYKQLRACTARIEVQQQDGRVAFVDVRGSRELVPVDAQYFDMAMGKLLCNAFKYSVGNPSPMVIIQFKASEIEIKILDFGIGVPVGERDKLFSGFFRCSNVGYIEGVGLGLAIAKKLWSCTAATSVLKQRQTAPPHLLPPSLIEKMV